MAWIWSDDLAAAAEAAGLEHAELISWKHRPVAFATGSDQASPALARQLLGIAPDEAEERDLAHPCACGFRADPVLAPTSPEG